MDTTAHENPGGYCDKCYGLFSTTAGLEALISAGGYMHHNGTEAKASAARGCPLCRRLLMKWPDSVSMDSDQLVCWAALNGSRCQASLTGYHHEVLVSSVPYVFNGLICFRQGAGESTHQRFVKSFTLFSTADDKAATLLPIRPPLTDVGSEAGLKAARHFLHTCQESHVSCRTREDTRDPAPMLPTRVIDIGANDNNSMRLHVSEPRECGNYAALSYCWGGPQPVLLTLESAGSMIKGIPYDKLPQTLRDAIQVTRSLGLCYLWIDALCIIQNDESPSKQAELSRMGSLYKNATVTIFASCARSVSEGFLHPRLVLPALSLPILCSDGSFGTAQLVIGERHELMYPLETRGWSMQECLLSRRKLIYGDRELVWECETSVKAPFPSSYLEPDGSYRQLPQRIFQSDGDILTTEETEVVWRRAVAAYTARELSVLEDRLDAVTGLITELQPFFQDECIFGLWRKSFICQLAWYRADIVCPTGKNWLLKCAPEWSWASRSFSVSMLSYMPEDKDGWELLSDNRIVLHRRLKRGRDILLTSDKWTAMLDFREPTTENKAYIPTFCLQHEGQDVFYFPLELFERNGYDSGELTMAVVKVGLPDTFRRIGIVTNNSGSSWFEGLAKQTVILL